MDGDLFSLADLPDELDIEAPPVGGVSNDSLVHGAGGDTHGVPDLALGEWCEGCRSLRQELQKVHADHDVNYNMLKEKIIQTDMLIKRYNAKCQECENTQKHLESANWKLDKVQRDCDTMAQNLKTTLEEGEPLRKAKEKAEKQKDYLKQKVQEMEDKLRAFEATQRQVNMVREDQTSKLDKLETECKTLKEKVKELEAGVKKTETVKKKSEDDMVQKNKRLSQLKQQITRQGNKQKKYEARISYYEGILIKHGLKYALSTRLGRQSCDSSIVSHDLSGDWDIGTNEMADEDEEENGEEEVERVFQEMCVTDSLLEPLSPALSPLPASPGCSRQNSLDEVEPMSEDDTGSESSCNDGDLDLEGIADQLEDQLLHLSPTKSPHKAESNNIIPTKLLQRQLSMDEGDGNCSEEDQDEINGEIPFKNFQSRRNSKEDETLHDANKNEQQGDKIDQEQVQAENVNEIKTESHTKMEIKKLNHNTPGTTATLDIDLDMVPKQRGRSSKVVKNQLVNSDSKMNVCSETHNEATFDDGTSRSRRVTRSKSCPTGEVDTISPVQLGKSPKSELPKDNTKNNATAMKRSRSKSSCGISPVTLRRSPRIRRQSEKSEPDSQQEKVNIDVDEVGDSSILQKPHEDSLKTDSFHQEDGNSENNPETNRISTNNKSETSGSKNICDHAEIQAEEEIKLETLENASENCLKGREISEFTGKLSDEQEPMEIKIEEGAESGEIKHEVRTVVQNSVIDTNSANNVFQEDVNSTQLPPITPKPSEDEGDPQNVVTVPANKSSTPDNTTQDNHSVIEPPPCDSKPPPCDSKPPPCGSKPPPCDSEPPPCDSEPPPCDSEDVKIELDLQADRNAANSNSQESSNLENVVKTDIVPSEQPSLPKQSSTGFDLIQEDYSSEHSTPSPVCAPQQTDDNISKKSPWTFPKVSKSPCSPVQFSLGEEVIKATLSEPVNVIASKITTDPDCSGEAVSSLETSEKISAVDGDTCDIDNDNDNLDVPMTSNADDYVGSPLDLEDDDSFSSLSPISFTCVEELPAPISPLSEYNDVEDENPDLGDVDAHVDMNFELDHGSKVTSEVTTITKKNTAGLNNLQKNNQVSSRHMSDKPVNDFNPTARVKTRATRLSSSRQNTGETVVSSDGQLSSRGPSPTESIDSHESEIPVPKRKAHIRKKGLAVKDTDNQENITESKNIDQISVVLKSDSRSSSPALSVSSLDSVNLRIPKRRAHVRSNSQNNKVPEKVDKVQSRDPSPTLSQDSNSCDVPSEPKRHSHIRSKSNAVDVGKCINSNDQGKEGNKITTKKRKSLPATTDETVPVKSPRRKGLKSNNNFVVQAAINIPKAKKLVIDKELDFLLRFDAVRPTDVASKLRETGVQMAGIFQEICRLLENAVTDVISSWNTRCQCEQVDVTAPWLTKTESKLVMLINALCANQDEDDLLSLFIRTVMQRFSVGSMKFSVPVSGLQSLGRTVMALCRLKGDKERACVFVYDCVLTQVQFFPSLVCAMAGSWPSVLQKPATGAVSPIIQVLEHVIMVKYFHKSKPRHAMMMSILSRLCSWQTVENLSETSLLAELLLGLKIAARHPTGLTAEYERAVDLLAAHQPWGWVNNILVLKFVWPVLQSWSSAKDETDKPSEGYVASLLHLLGLVMSRCPKECLATTKQTIMTLSALLKGTQQDKLTAAIQMATVRSLVRLSPFDPELVVPALQEWMQKKGQGHNKQELSLVNHCLNFYKGKTKLQNSCGKS